MNNSYLPWLAASTGSRSDLESAGSSTNMLYSIYGSQVSQLPISLEEEREEIEFQKPFSTSHLSRPKSAPLNNSTINHRYRIKSARPRNPPQVPQRQEPVISHLTRRVSSRPMSALPNTYQMHAQIERKYVSRRPNTARPMRRLSSPFPSVNNEEYSIQTPLRMKESSTPVLVSGVPQYFNFWAEKPLKPRDWDIKTHPRKQWKRPRSNYGSRIFTHNRGVQNNRDKNEEGVGVEGRDHMASLCEEDELYKCRSGRSLGERGDIDDNGINKINEEDEEGRITDGDLDINDLEDQSHDTNNESYDRSHDLLSKDFGNEGRTSEYKHMTGRNDAEDDSYFMNKQFKESKWLDLLGGGGSTTRFSLPVDLKILEKMTPSDYLCSYCVICQQRRSHYSKVFSNLTKNRKEAISKTELIQGLINAHHQLLTIEQANSIIQLVDLPTDWLVSLQLFGAMCVLTERMFGPSCLPFALRKEIIEVVDFEALDWRLRTCKIKDSLRTLFAQIIM